MGFEMRAINNLFQSSRISKGQVLIEVIFFVFVMLLFIQWMSYKGGQLKKELRKYQYLEKERQPDEVGIYESQK